VNQHLFETRPVGNSGVSIARLGLGTAALGGWPEAVSVETGVATIQRAWDCGIRYFDTAPFYGYGQAERYLAAALAGKPRSEFQCSTKTGRRLVEGAEEVEFFKGGHSLHSAFDFSAEGVAAAIHDSRKRLQMGAPDIVYIHDPNWNHEEVLRDSYPRLRAMRDEGEFAALGVGMNSVEHLCRFAQEAEFDVFMLAGRYTLLEQTALDVLFPLVTERNIAVVAAGVLNSGLLVDPKPGSTYDYGPASDEILGKATAIAAVCLEFEVPLRAAALQFTLAHPAVTSAVMGARSPGEVDDTLAMVQYPIPGGLWTELKHRGLVREDAPIPHGTPR
jgi:aryl-alcohol dehydrogenase-like predicted oxidoreductase